MALTRREVNEEITFFRDICGWSEQQIERRLGLYHGTLAQRRYRAARKKSEQSVEVDTAA